MSDSYQAIYDAVRSRISNGDVGSVVADIARQAFDLAFAKEVITTEFARSAMEMQRPCVLYRPAVSIDGDMWRALYGDNLQDGVAGFGKSPALAMDAFDAEWRKTLGAA